MTAPLPSLDLRPPFASPPPVVELVNAFASPYDNAVATARTCYSGHGIVTADQVRTKPEQRDRVARSTYEAGHHTTLQHAHFQFALSNVSRQFIWSFLHSHPFYNSEQVSQRYVTVKPETTAIAPLSGQAATIYADAVAHQHRAYTRLIELLRGPAAREYFRLFPARAKQRERYERDVVKKAQEIARYVLPVATQAYLYHTISGLTLLRYWRLCEQRDASAETRFVVGRMVEELLRVDPQFATILQPPIPFDDTPEAHWFAARPAGSAHVAAFVREFDHDLGGLTSRLIDAKPRNQELVATAVREVLGLTRAMLPDEDALRLALDPARNRLHGEALTLTTLSKLSRALLHANYTFRKKLSHTADSQDQRHRLTPASRPILTAHLQDEPDVVEPVLLRHSAPARDLFRDTMARTWEAVRRLRELGVDDEWRGYLLPNAVAVRFTESADLLNLHHKLKMRLCYNAQEEIWKASVDEARQIRDIEPAIGALLLPPCGLRKRSETRPLCPEGDRYCGVPVWKLDVDEYARVI